MIKVRTALLSVFDKTGIIELAKHLVKNEVEILSSGGTAKHLIKNGIDVTEVSKYTGSPEMFDGRVKTLHPKIHAGILARGKQDHEELKKLGIKKIDLVVVNLYPFSEEVAKDTSEQNIIEKIDIGGPAMLRASAKNFKHTITVCNPTDYSKVKVNGMSIKDSKKLAYEVFKTTQNYDLSISDWFGNTQNQLKEIKLRYGENPHQKASFLVDEDCPIDFQNVLQGKQISYNNVVDAISAWACCNEFSEPTVSIVKHTNPCGVASSNSLLNAYEKAFSTDPTSAFGGVIALNKNVDASTAGKMIANQFIEVLIAPDYDEEALKALKTKPNIRVLKSMPRTQAEKEMKTISGVHLVQDIDDTKIDQLKLNTISIAKPTKDDLEDLTFAMKVAKHVKSNAIVLAKNKMTLGIGAGQMSRVVSTKIALMKAKEQNLNTNGCILASDAFFPFRDNIDLAAKNGIKHIIQPGGSVKDEEIIAAADEHQLSMTLTGVRHFKH